MKKKMYVIFIFFGIFSIVLLSKNIISEKYLKTVSASELNNNNSPNNELDLIETDGEALEKDKKIAYLTFDDGPSKNTYKILDILRYYNIKATFFVNGKPVYKDVYLRMNKEGHLIGNHTYSHEYKDIYESVDNFRDDVNKLNRLLMEYGIKPKYILRFPGGSNNTASKKYGGDKVMDELIQIMSEEGYQYYDWNVTSGDADKQPLSKEEIIKNVVKGCREKNNVVILFHDLNSKVSTVEAIPDIIEYLLQENYEFRVLNSNENSIIHFK